MPEKKLIIAIVGMAGAGKSSAAKLLKDKNFTVLRFGDQTDIGLKEQGLPLTEENERRYRERLRKQLGMAAYAIKIKPRIIQALSENKLIALDGLYSWEEHLYLKKYFKELILLCIYARPEVRYKRLKERKIRGLEKQQIQERDFRELERLNKGGPIAMADYLIENDGSLINLNQKIEHFLWKIRLD